MHLPKITYKHLVFVSSFIVAKGTVFFVPLLLADSVSQNDFGIIEYSLAGLGMLVNSFIDVGVSAAYPYYILKKEDKGIENGFELHPIWLSLFFAINCILYTLDFYGLIVFMAFTISYIISSQNFYASKLKTKEKVNTAVFVSSGIYFILLILLVISFTEVYKLTIRTINVGIQSYALVIVLYGWYKFFKNREKLILKKYIRILKFSINLLVSSILLFSITVSGRILVEYFFDFDEVAVYSFYYRLSAIVVMIYQVVAIFYFKKIYTQAPKILDKYFSAFFALIFLCSFVFYITSQFIVGHFSNFYEESIGDSKELFFMLSCQMVMWIATALNSNIIDREGIARINNIRIFILFMIGKLTLYINENVLTVEKLVFIIYTFFYLTVLIQYFSLYKKAILFKKSSIYVTLIYLFSIFYLHYVI